MQNGNIFRKGDSWFLRYYRDEVKDGKIVRRRVCQRLAPFCDEYRTVKSVRLLAAETLNPLNTGKLRAESTQTVRDFIEEKYLPYVREHKRPSTQKGYLDIFEDHVRDRLFGIRMREFRTIDGERLLSAIASDNKLSHRSLIHIKSFVSGVFTYARRIGVLDSHNPMRDVSIPKGLPSKPTHAYSLDEIQTMLPLLPEPGRTIATVAAFTGLGLSELRGLRWEDIDENQIRVCRTFWRRHPGETKTHARTAPVPMLPIVAKVLEEHRKHSLGAEYVFAGPYGRPRDLASMGTKILRPALAGSGIEWYGWHAFRRGLATNLFKLGVPDKTIQTIMRHSNMSTTMMFYVKTSSDDSIAAMARLGRAWRKNGQQMGNRRRAPANK